MNININVTDKGVDLKVDQPTNIQELLAALFSAQLGAMKGLLDKVPDEHKQVIKEDLYDKYNIGASNVLHFLAPDLDLRPDLTVDAILEAENKIINERYEKLTPEQKKNYKFK